MSDNHFLGALLEPSLPSRVEREDTLNTPLWEGLADTQGFLDHVKWGGYGQYGYISRTGLLQSQHSLATMVEGPPSSPQTEPPRSQHYSQRVSNQTNRNHNYKHDSLVWTNK